MAKTQSVREQNKLRGLTSLHGTLGVIGLIASLISAAGCILGGIFGYDALSKALADSGIEINAAIASVLSLAGLYLVVIGVAVLIYGLLAFLHNRTVCAVLSSLECIINNTSGDK